MKYYTYIIRCQDNSLYTGITNNIERRLKEHFNKDKKCAKYTRVHQAIKLESLWQSTSRSNASKLEYKLKRLSKDKKEQLIKNNELFSNLLPTLDKTNYKKSKS